MNDGLYTTGEAARLCRLSQQSIIRAVDAGRLNGFRVPGSNHRRIARQDLAAFMRHNRIPTDLLDDGPTRLTLEATTELVTLDGVVARVWEGHTAKGTPVHAFIVRVGVHEDEDQLEFQHLAACRAPSAELPRYPARMTL